LLAAAGLNRYGIAQGNGGNYAWSTVTPAAASNTAYARWNASVNAAAPADGSGDFRYEPNQFGWVVEIDPYDPSKAPRKRTALGRMAHEGAWPSQFVAGRRPAFYMGDDSRGEYLYKFVSATPWAAGDAQNADRLAIGDKYLDSGTLYVARFNADGTGIWLPLVFGQGVLTPANSAYPFADQADVLIHARLAGDALGATRMDRPEWTAINPQTGEMYLTLTNNNAGGRPITGTNAANPRHYNDPKLRPGFTDKDENAFTDQRGNPNGHIIRIREAGDNSEATSFTWDIYVFGAGADLPAHVNLSALNDTNDFSSPDGLWFARESSIAGKVTPVLWIQTDDGAYTDVTNNQMLAAMPGRVGDGGARTVNNVGANGATGAQPTFVGAAPGTNLKRFMVGPVECEITGIDSTPDGRTIFVNIQHPGEDVSAADFAAGRFTSNWPANQTDPAARGRPRSATVVVTKSDGGVVAL
jgi:secreted PhoX family phosphatase